jgi:hypothetical protein
VKEERGERVLGSEQKKRVDKK